MENVGNNEPIKLVLVDESKDALVAAVDQADKKMTEELSPEDRGKLRNFVNSIWKGGIAKDYYRRKYTQQSYEQITSAQDTLVFEADNNKRGSAKQATVDRFLNEYDEMIHTEAGESREVQSNDSEISKGINTLIKAYCTGAINDATLLEEKTRLFGDYQKSRGVDSVKELVMADNVLEVARAVMGAVDHGESIDNILNNIQIITGEARTGVRTEVQYNKVDAVIDKLSKTKIGSLVGPETMSVAASVAINVVKISSNKAAKIAGGAIIGGAVAGVWAGIRENKRSKDDRTQHLREMATGGDIKPGDVRREEMEKTRYKAVSAKELTENVNLMLETESLDLGGDEALSVALDSLAAINTRIGISDSRKIDLITFSDSSSITSERLGLDIARAKLKRELNNRLTDEVRGRLGLESSSLADINRLVNSRSIDEIELIETDISSKDAAFNKLKSARVKKAALIGAATGATFGLVTQEIMAAIDPSQSGLLEQVWGGNNAVDAGHSTLLHSLITGNQTVIHTGPETSFSSPFEGGPNSTLSVSSDHSIVPGNTEHSFSLKDPNNHLTAENLKLNLDGSIPKETLDKLHELGMTVNDKSFTQEVIETQNKVLSVSEFMKNHEDTTTNIVRKLWYDNNTPNKFDLNELKLWWGGNNGLTDTGFKFDVSHMTEGGSSHGNDSANYRDLINSGHLKMAFSASIDSQNQVFILDINPDGSVDIPADSPTGHLFSNENGHAVFHGAYAEVVETGGKDANGAEIIKPLATHIGENNINTINDNVKIVENIRHNNYEIITNGYDTVRENATDMPPIIPIVPRRPMEVLKSREDDNRINRTYYYSGEYMSNDESERLARETSPRILADKNADLNPAEEYSWYKEQIRKNMGEEYLEDIKKVVESSPELKSINSDIKAIIKIPVNAAGKAESEKIYDVLTKAYGGQGEDALRSSLIVLHVNWFDRYNEDDDQMRANIERTRSEITRAKADFSNMKIAIVETEWNRDEIKGGVIGHVSRKLNDVVLMALDSAVSSGRMSRDHDVILVRNDSDPIGISKNYINNYIKAFESNPETDVFTGTTTFDNTKASKLPGFVFAANFLQAQNTISSSKGGYHTGGANFGVRASTFAAVSAIGFDVDGTGAGSDDVAIGRRIAGARAYKRAGTQNGYHDTPGGGGVALYKQGKRKVAMRVFGAKIDTDSDRGEVLYEQGIPIINQWNPEHGFDSGGYKPRHTGLSGRFEESLDSNGIDDVIEHIKSDISGTIEVMNIESLPDTRKLLTILFYGLDGDRGYEMYWVKENGVNKCRFKFTDVGVKYLKRYLTVNSLDKKPESYGGRKMRQMYGELFPGPSRAIGPNAMIKVS